jgi:hypothetical protein
MTVFAGVSSFFFPARFFFSYREISRCVNTRKPRWLKDCAATSSSSALIAMAHRPSGRLIKL